MRRKRFKGLQVSQGDAGSSPSSFLFTGKGVTPITRSTAAKRSKAPRCSASDGEFKLNINLNHSLGGFYSETAKEKEVGRAVRVQRSSIFNQKPSSARGESTGREQCLQHPKLQSNDTSCRRYGSTQPPAFLSWTTPVVQYQPEHILPVVEIRTMKQHKLETVYHSSDLSRKISTTLDKSTVLPFAEATIPLATPDPSRTPVDRKSLKA
eukprot:873616-Prorocentrum_minimum.AAC.1